MDPRLFPIPCLFILITILNHVPASVAVDDTQFTNCSQLLQCGNTPGIGYPFWGGNRPEFCGHPSFGLNCQGEAPLITIEARQYRILSITNESYALTVAREDFWNDDCPQYLHNATLDTTHFNYGSNMEDLILYYSCRTPTSGVQNPNEFACTQNSSTGTFGIYATASLSNTINASVACGSSVIVKVNQTAAQALAQTSTANLTEVLNSGLGLQWNANNTVCETCAGSGGRCGSNTSTGSFVCYCPDQPYPLTCSASTSTGGSGSTKGSNRKLELGIGFSSVGLTVILIVTFCCLKKRCMPLHDMAVALRKKGRVGDQKIEAFLRHYGSLAPKRYRYSDLYKMTNSFKDKLGQGGYGVVYKGKRPDGFLVAVKVLSEIKGNGEEFINEVSSISRTSHVNVVTLLGFCFERNRRALIYEFMANGSLDKFIYSDESMYLEFRTLFQIAVGTARGLEYLHRGCATRIVHFDIKPQNILLDENFCPKISDFGLAKLCEKKESIISMTGTRGTIGYIAPEVFSRAFGSVSQKSDVYSYGMLILEMIGAREKVGSVSGTSEVYFPHWVYEQLEHGTDLRLHRLNTKEEEETARMMLLVGLWCIQTNPSDRPPMTRVVEMLEGSLESLRIPPKPYLCSPKRPDPSDRDTFESSPTVSHVVDVSAESVQPLRTFT